MAGSGTAAWLPKRPEQAPAGVRGPQFAGPGQAPAPQSTSLTQTGGRATRRFRFGSEDRSDPDPPLAAGSVVGDRYRILRLLGEGGMGRVYEAQHVVLGRHVALKLLRRDAAAEPENLARFRQEALTASRIGTPQIVEVVDFASHVGVGGQQTYMVMELLVGESLEAWIDRHARLDEGLLILAELCDGLAAAHRANVVHRDIKPANVYLPRSDPTRSDGARVKILDFGIAKITAGGEGFQTRQGSLLGTPYYLAPERVMGAQLTGAADLYSVGVILYEMLTGVVPFVADSFMGILANHVHTEPLDPRQAAPSRSIPAAVAQICMTLLSKDPAARPSAEAIASELRGLLGRERDAIAAVVTGPREGVSGSDVDTQVFHEGTHALPLAERPTLAPTQSPDPSARSGTTIGHALAGSPIDHAGRVEPLRPVARPGMAAVIGLGLLGGVVVAGALWFGLRGDRYGSDDAAAVDEQSVDAEPQPAITVPTPASPETGGTPTSPPITVAPTTVVTAAVEPREPAPAALEPTPEREVRTPKSGAATKPKPKPDPEPDPKPKVNPATSEDPEPAPAVDPEKPDLPAPTPEPNPELPTIKDDVYD